MSLISFNIYILTNIGNNIKKLRDVNKISRETLAEMISIPKKRMTMIEEGNYINLTVIECEKIAFSLKTSVNQLID
jgi:DNA-binding XRE family transcriptional regulator